MQDITTAVRNNFMCSHSDLFNVTFAISFTVILKGDTSGYTPTEQETRISDKLQVKTLQEKYIRHRASRNVT
jgi:hypothetical protein